MAPCAWLFQWLMAEPGRQLEIPPSGTRGAKFQAWMLGLLRPLSEGQVARYRKTAGPVPPTMAGFPTVVLTTIGARTGQERSHVLGGFPDGDDAWLIVASKGGAATHPAWFINLARNPDRIWLEVGNRKLHVNAELLKGAQREAALARVAGVSPRYGEYQRKTDREIPVIRLTPAA